MFIKLKPILVILLIVFVMANVRSEGQTKMRQNNSNAISFGEWGGVGIQAVVDETGIAIELDCAAAKIIKSIRTDRSGKFLIAGSFTAGARGPIRLGFQPKPQPAHFSGTVKGRSMKLKITLDSTKETVGEYSLQHGKEGVLHRCR